MYLGGLVPNALAGVGADANEGVSLLVFRDVKEDLGLGLGGRLGRLVLLGVRHVGRDYKYTIWTMKYKYVQLLTVCYCVKLVETVCNRINLRGWCGNESSDHNVGSRGPVAYVYVGPS
jgi:hypothetical protein